VMHHADRIDRWTYADLRDRAMDVARALVAIGVGKDSRVGILMTNRPEWLSAAFGAWLAGAVAVPLSTFSTEPELAHLLDMSSVSVLLFEGHVLKKDFTAMLGGLEPEIATAAPGGLRSTRFPFLRHFAVVDGEAGGAIESWASFLARAEGTPPAIVEAIGETVRPADLGGLFFSSGSTATPKGILNTHRGIAVQFWRWRRIEALEADVRAWTPNGFFWSGNCGSVMGATLAAGGSLVLQSTFLPAEALTLMARERVNYPVIWPHQAKLLEEAPNWAEVDLGAMRYLDPGNVLARHPTVKPSGWEEPASSYGSTETFTITTSYVAGTPAT
jgi:fatty-acyl-CoA synthase